MYNCFVSRSFIYTKTNEEGKKVRAETLFFLVLWIHVGFCFKREYNNKDISDLDFNLYPYIL